MSSLRIVRIIKVVDTREYEEGPGDRFYPIPGSGKEHECARCGRLHEVHALVQLETGDEAIVGTGCAARESLDMAPLFRKADGLAKRLRRLEDLGLKGHVSGVPAVLRPQRPSLRLQ